jgi:flagellar biosynthesis/type III secretory pathway protein FliH
MKKGFEDGLKRGSEKGYKDTQTIRNQAGNVLKEAQRVSREYIDAQRGEIVDLAMAIAEKIIGYQADTNDSVVISIVKDAISSSVYREQLIIRVNPMDYAIIDCRRDEIVKMAGGDKIINIIRDDEIKRGGCRLDTGASSVDAAIDEQLQKIKEALLGQ